MDISFASPYTQNTLRSDNTSLYDPETLESFPILNGIPRFCGLVNYSESFGYQWNIFDDTQLDPNIASDLSEQRFYAVTSWTPESLSTLNVLEVGSGAGRFSEVFLRTTTATLYSVDYSSAVDANLRNNAEYGTRLRLAQASILELPFPDNSFDRVFCLGVLQHTPSFADSVSALIRKTRVGGEIVVDFYPIKGWYTRFHSKYILRPITKRLPKPLLLKLIRVNIYWMLPLFDFLCIANLSVLTRFVPITDVRGFPHGLPRSQRREWAVLDTFDAFSPEYDNPQRVQDVVRMFTSLGCDVTHAGLVTYASGSTTVVRAVKRNG